MAIDSSMPFGQCAIRAW